MPVGRADALLPEEAPLPVALLPVLVPAEPVVVPLLMPELPLVPELPVPLALPVVPLELPVVPVELPLVPLELPVVPDTFDEVRIWLVAVSQHWVLPVAPVVPVPEPELEPEDVCAAARPTPPARRAAESSASVVFMKISSGGCSSASADRRQCSRARAVPVSASERACEARCKDCTATTGILPQHIKSKGHGC
jgi:hypothetical protein